MIKTTTRRRFTAAFMKKACVEAFKQRESTELLAKKFNIHPNQINASRACLKTLKPTSNKEKEDKCAVLNA